MVTELLIPWFDSDDKPCSVGIWWSMGWWPELDTSPCRWLLLLFSIAGWGFVVNEWDPAGCLLYGRFSSACGAKIPRVSTVLFLKQSSDCSPDVSFWDPQADGRFCSPPVSFCELEDAEWTLLLARWNPCIWLLGAASSSQFCWGTSTVQSSSVIPFNSSPGSLNAGRGLFTLIGRPKFIPKPPPPRLALGRRTDRFIHPARLSVPRMQVNPQLHEWDFPNKFSIGKLSFVQ